ncbi:hydrogenase maturation protease [Halobacillus sp. Marseille-Q1614]|uniref:hydrogenase maturation protease n=1 Tax=Halobacillus sp. Marseille-Q1614 TaxID=2709134 RepID=UPI00156E9B69|nr:hydrogenase maturation protease [Halobacillus sp. Marseille-Q1614]
MEKVIVLGIGNQLMMDDGIGIYLTEELAKQKHPENISYLIGESDIDYCLQQIEQASYMIILDTVRAGKEPGELSIFPINNLHEQRPLDISPHNIHLFQSLYLQRDTLKGFLIGIEPFEIKFHIGLSAPLKGKWDTILRDVRITIDQLLKDSH